MVNQSHVGTRNQPTLRDQLQAVFERDWNSKYSQDLDSLDQWQGRCGVY